METNDSQSAQILEKVKELKKESENLEGHLPWCEDCVYDACRHISRNVDRDSYSSCTHDGMMFGYDGGFIARVCNAFPSIASLCLEQAKEIKRLREDCELLGKTMNNAVEENNTLRKLIRDEKKKSANYLRFVPPCIICKKRKGLTEHHLVPRSMGGGNDDPSMWGNRKIKICRPCHDAIHRSASDEVLADKYRSIDLILNDKQFFRTVISLADSIALSPSSHGNYNS